MVTVTVPEKRTQQRRQMSYEEYLAFAGESQIVEWVDGEVITYMPPIYEHQNIVLFLVGLIDTFAQAFELGKTIPAPFEVKLWPGGPSREPDMIFIANDNLPKLSSKRFAGAPDLIVEVISPSSATEDRVKKFREYEQAGVGEYWLIDPRPHQQQADFYVLGVDHAYFPAPIETDGKYRASLIPDFWLDINWLWQDPLPSTQLALAEIMISIETLAAEAKAVYQALYQLLAGK